MSWQEFLALGLKARSFSMEVLGVHVTTWDIYFSVLGFLAACPIMFVMWVCWKDFRKKRLA